MKRVLTGVLLSMLLAAAAVADGPETGIIEGKVTDASGAALPGVTVTIESPRGQQAAITDDSGSYRFALLVPGEYNVKAELEGFQGTSHNATVTAGGKHEVDLKLSMGTTEEITVTSEAPMVDKFNVTAGATVSSEIGEQTAGSTRTYYGVINTMPGVTNDSQNQDIQQTRPSVNGNHWADQQVFIDGVDSSFARFGGSRVFLPTTAVTEVSMEAGGSGAEYGRKIGSTTNVIVKSGTNKFHADGLVQRQEVDWDADYDNHVEITQRQHFPAPADFLRRTEAEKEGTSTGYELSLGGPILRDKAWFFLGWSEFDTNDLDKALNSDPIDVSLNNEARIGKINFQPSAKHQLALSWIDTPASRVYFNPEANDYWTPTPHVVDGELGTLNWNFSINSNLFVETKIATQTSDENKFLACGGTSIDTCLALKQQDRGPDADGPLRFPPNPAAGQHWPGNNYRVYLDTLNDGAWNNGWILDNGFGLNEFPRDQANASLTQFAGANHELKYGVDWQQVEWLSEVSRPGLYSGPLFSATNPFGYSLATGLPVAQHCGVARGEITAANPNGRSICLYRDYNAPALLADRGTGDSLNEDLSLYVRDRFTVGDHWTFNLGLRYEDMSGENDIGRTVFEDQHVSPRLAMSYDIGGDGKKLITFNAGRYYAQLNQQWTNEFLQDHWGGYAEYDDWLFCDAFDVFLGSLGVPALRGCATGAGPGGVPGQPGYNFFLRSIRPGDYWDLADAGIFDSDLKPYYKDELIGGFEWQVSNNWALDTKAIWWEMGDMLGSTVQADPYGSQFQFTANYNDYPDILRAIEAERARVTTVPCPSAAATGCIRNGQYVPLMTEEILSHWRDGSKEYKALQVQLNRRFANGWALYNNVTWSEVETTGAGAWWNNTNDDYGEDLHVTLTQAHIDACTANQTLKSPITGNPRTYPVGPPDNPNCNVLQPFLGTPVSLINRLGNEATIDRPIILNSFGFKTFNFGKQDLTVGGHLNFQSGTFWTRTESVGSLSLDGNVARNDSVNLLLAPVGDRQLDDIYVLNLSAAWGFPLGFENLHGTLRVEGLNVTDQQELTLVTGTGEPRPVRRDFQRPRQLRASFAVRW